MPHERRQVLFIVSNRSFETLIMSCILFNFLTMCLQTYPSPSENFETTMVILNLLFAAAFNIEFVLKFYAYRKAYFKETWNCFNFLCVAAMVLCVGILFDVILKLGIGSVVSVVRLFRIARLFCLVRFMNGFSSVYLNYWSAS